MDAAHWPQEIGLLKPVSCSSSSYSSPPSSSSSSMAELIMVPPPPPPPPSSMASSTITRTPQLIERRTRPSKEQALHCPRCSSTNTKFCYYNNYSLTQPRYFCKTCRRYWTEGGSLRNVPVGGGSRKNKKSTTTTATAAPPPPPPPPPSSSSANVKRLPGLPPDELNPNFQEVKDYSLSFYGNDSMSNNPFAPPPQEAAAGSVLYPSGAGLGLPSFLSSAINHPMNTATMQEGGGGDGRLILPFQDFTQVHPAFEQDRGQGSNASSGLWNGVMGGGPPW